MKFFIHIILFLVLPVFSYANHFGVSGYAEGGARSTAEDYFEEELDDDYDYLNTHLKFEHRVSERLRYDIRSFLYRKNYYHQDELDNHSALLHTKWSYDLKTDFSRLDLSFKYREKQYDQSPSGEYQQLAFYPALRMGEKDVYTLIFNFGFNRYHYNHSHQNNQSKLFGKIGYTGYFIDKRFVITSSYKIENTAQEAKNREKMKHDLMGGFYCLMRTPWMYKLTGRITWAVRDTKDEDRDYDFDYRYLSGYLRSDHRIRDHIKIFFRTQILKKDYLNVDYDHETFLVQNGWDYNLSNDSKKRVWCDLESEYKQIRYLKRSDNHYRKMTGEVRMTYRRKRNWKTSFGFAGSFYHYKQSQRDKVRLFLSLYFEKLMLNSDLVLSLNLKYRFTGYEYMHDTQHEAIRFTFQYGF